MGAPQCFGMVLFASLSGGERLMGAPVLTVVYASERSNQLCEELPHRILTRMSKRVPATVVACAAAVVTCRVPSGSMSLLECHNILIGSDKNATLRAYRPTAVVHVKLSTMQVRVPNFQSTVPKSE